MSRDLTHKDVEAVIAAQFARDDLAPEDVLALTIARRLNGLSDSLLAKALGGEGDTPPLNFWGRR